MMAGVDVVDLGGDLLRLMRVALSSLVFYSAITTPSSSSPHIPFYPEPIPRIHLAVLYITKTVG